MDPRKNPPETMLTAWLKLWAWGLPFDGDEWI
jgi:hypothetical protein